MRFCEPSSTASRFGSAIAYRARDLLPAILVLAAAAEAQIQLGAVRGHVEDPSGARVGSARVTLSDPHGGAVRRTETGADGGFRFSSVAFGRYVLRVERAGFERHEREVVLRSALPVELVVGLRLAGTTEAVTVAAESLLLAPDRLGTRVGVDEASLRRLPGARPSAGFQQLVAARAGWASEDNGLLHSRGVDDGFSFVTDGIPSRDRADAFFSSAIDLDAIEALEILEGHLPAEYGNASGGVFRVVPRSGLDSAWRGTLAGAFGSERSGELAATLGGAVAEQLGVLTAASYGGSGRRFLDPVDPANFNNSGSAARFYSRLDWRPTALDLFVSNLSMNGSGFRVPNSLEQEEAGQRQRQELRDDHQSLVWQRSWSSETVSDLAVYRRSFDAELLPSEFDTPISAAQDRGHSRIGALVNVTHQAGRHVLEAGAGSERVSVRERFAFFVTDDHGAEEAGLDDDTLELLEQAPFSFEDSVQRSQSFFYVQDTFDLGSRLTVNAGLRFDKTSVLVEDSAWSPRLAAVYYFPEQRTSVRASYNRLFTSPQVENLLLSSSEQARKLSPFQADEADGGAGVAPERQHAFEVGFATVFGGYLQLDAAYWGRRVENYADPNVFFGTTILFPNSVARGEASGVQVRLEATLRDDLRVFATYSNSLVVQEGPINGGLFLEDEVIEIGAGTRFIPDHDQRNTGAFGVTYRHAGSGLWAALHGRHESGTPLEIEEEAHEELRERRGAELVDFERGRVKARTLFDLSLGMELLRDDRVGLELQLDVRNLADRPFAYNFSNPFSGTHFGHPRLVSVRAKLRFR